MSSLKRVIVLILAVLLTFGMSTASSADSKNSEAGKAFADAIYNGMIGYSDSMNYNIADMDGDGVVDLLIDDVFNYAAVYSYKSGEIVKIFDFYPDTVLQYDSDKHIFWMTGEGDGGWVYAYKYKSGSLVLKYKYTATWVHEKIVYRYQKEGKKAKKITRKKYMKAWNYASKWRKQTTSSGLVSILKNL